ncbi:hypothetical protein Glove_319g74 [Diversispora epigaea]|uniref:Uncharacterized protein n=1 Tax=Diversispora epigaea TaxID=1348612 RepID=A0A397HPE0_9GLOM|nr:hypothetical protein Glove_319g74 [Diversispora epigaea]
MSTTNFTITVTDGGVDGVGSKQSFSQVMEDEEEDDDDEIKTKSIFQPKRIIDSQGGDSGSNFFSSSSVSMINLLDVTSESLVYHRRNFNILFLVIIKI